MHLASHIKTLSASSSLDYENSSFDHIISIYRRYKVPSIEQIELLCEDLEKIRNEEPIVKVLEEGIEKLWADYPILKENFDKDREKLNPPFDLGHEWDEISKKLNKYLEEWEMKYSAISYKDNKVVKVIVKYFKKDNTVKREFTIEKGMNFVRRKNDKSQQCTIEGFYPCEQHDSPIAKIRLKKNNRIARSDVLNLRPS